MRILIVHGQYDHLNLGDVAMLQSCINRLQREWRNPEIMVLTNSPSLLKYYCPGSTGVRLTYADLPFIKLTPRKIRDYLERISHRVALSSWGLGRNGSRRYTRSRTPLQAIRAADIVIASGGGYITDVFADNAAGVLRILRLAQILGKPTAIFGQGLGPITCEPLRKLASAVFPNLSAIGLREDRIGLALATSLGADPSIVTLTGDDALEDLVDRGIADGDAIGVNIRIANYAGVDATNAKIVNDVLVTAATAFGASIIGLPVSRQPADSDFNAIKELFPVQEIPLGTGSKIEFNLRDLNSPSDLAASAATCRVIITGSYHAAVFGLAQGIPAICLTKSAYYDAKFNGLKALFPAACYIVSLTTENLADQLGDAINEAWHLTPADRSITRESAVAQRMSGRDAYTRFRESVEKATMRSGAIHARG